MKIPSDTYIYANEPGEGLDIIRAWKATAYQIGIESGVYVKVGYTKQTNSGHIDRIYFVLGVHEFESLNNLKKAINNRAFL